VCLFRIEASGQTPGGLDKDRAQKLIGNECLSLKWIDRDRK
jgi:hypothetical protein